MPLINNYLLIPRILIRYAWFWIFSRTRSLWNVDNYVDFVIKFIKKFNYNELDLIGHSNGGRIIINY